MSRISLVVGCPVKDRNWILPTWREYVAAAVPSEIELNFLFVADSGDIETLELVSNWDRTSVVVSDVQYEPYQRSWGSPGSLEKMSDLRNTLLGSVRELAPDFFLSLDSDILVHPDAVVNMMETLESQDESFDYGACGGLTYMDPVDPRVTSVGMFNSTGFRRISTKGRPRVDLIMAIKLMNKTGYSVPYSYHRKGEDVGWCKNAASMGVKLRFDGRVGSKHVFDPQWLSRLDRRVGY